MEEKIKNEISKIIAGVIIKRFGHEFGLDCKEVVNSVLDEIRESVKVAKKEIETECLLRLRRRFQTEVEPIINNLDNRIEKLISNDASYSVMISTMARQELENALRERAREWAQKVSSAEVHFNFDTIFGH
jgi:hypothetical protein